MPNALVIYMDALIFDEAMDRRYFEKVARYCYRPATEMFQTLVEGGMNISLGFSFSFIRQMRLFGPDVLTGFQRMVRHLNVEPYHSFIFYLDIEGFGRRMAWSKAQLEETFQKPIAITDTTEMFMAND